MRDADHAEWRDMGRLIAEFSLPKGMWKWMVNHLLAMAIESFEYHVDKQIEMGIYSYKKGKIAKLSSPGHLVNNNITLLKMTLLIS
jgi:hypothetical protein